jgi:uncharacterized membrane protein
MKVAGRLRTYFLAGVVVAAPIGITIWLVWSIVSLFDTWVKPLIPGIYNPDTYLPFEVPGVGLVVALIVITLIGALAANLVGRTVLHYWEYFLGRMPVVRSVYSAVKQIFQTAFAKPGSNFQHVGLIEFPAQGDACRRLRGAPARQRRDRAGARRGHVFGVHADDAEPDLGVPVLCSQGRGHHPRPDRRGRRQARHFRRPGLARAAARTT